VGYIDHNRSAVSTAGAASRPNSCTTAGSLDVGYMDNNYRSAGGTVSRPNSCTTAGSLDAVYMDNISAVSIAGQHPGPTAAQQQVL
jgi:hypothetical protein